MVAAFDSPAQRTALRSSLSHGTTQTCVPRSVLRIRPRSISRPTRRYDGRTEGQREDKGRAALSSAVCQYGWMDWESPGRQGESGIGGVCDCEGKREGGKERVSECVCKSEIRQRTWRCRKKDKMKQLDSRIFTFFSHQGESLGQCPSLHWCCKHSCWIMYL